MSQLLKSNSSTNSPNAFSLHNLPDAFATFFSNKLIKLHLSLNSSIIYSQTKNSQLFTRATFNQFLSISTSLIITILHS